MQPVANETSRRSGDPISLSLDLFGDKWTLLILRDMMFSGKRHFRDLSRSEEGIASNILSDRLKKLVEAGMITKADDPSHKQKSVYSLTEKSIALVPVFAQLNIWGRRYLPVNQAENIRARLLEGGGPKMWERFMSELYEEHVAPANEQVSTSKRPSVAETLQSAYDAVVAQTQ